MNRFLLASSLSPLIFLAACSSGMSSRQTGSAGGSGPQVTDQSSITRFIEDTFLSGQRIGGGSFDSIAGPLDNMFDFSQSTPQNASIALLDDTTGEVTRDM